MHEQISLSMQLTLKHWNSKIMRNMIPKRDVYKRQCVYSGSAGARGERNGSTVKARILIAEDDVDIRDLMKLYLESEGYEILCSGDGAEALSLIEAYNPQLAMLDIMMPSMTGLEVTQVLRKKTMMPILILSAKGQDQDKILGLNMGADDYMAKPFNPLELVARVKALLRRADAQTSELRRGELLLRCV